MARSSDILVHGLQFEVASLEEIVDAYCGHIEQTIFACAIAVEEVVPKGCLKSRGYEVTSLYITSQVIVAFIDFLTLSKTNVHPVGLSSQIEFTVEPSKFQTNTTVVRALIFTLYVDRG